MATEKELRAAINEIESVDTLRSIFKDVADALRRKGVDQEIIYPNEYAGLIDGIDTVAAGTEDADAEETDIAKGKTAYAKGVKLIGSVTTIPAGNEVDIGNVTPYYNNSSKELGFSAVESTDILLREGSIPKGTIPGASLGDATQMDVMSGKTFTSENGLKLAGMASPGINTSDATATASDIVKDKTAYGPSGLITGNVPVVSNITQSLTPQVSQSYFDFYYNIPSDQLIRKGSQINLYCSSSMIGDAETADVASGKTFTSKNGLKLTGTMSNVGELIKSVFSTIGSSLNTISEIRKAFNYASFGFNADHQPDASKAPFVPFMNITLYPTLYITYNSSGGIDYDLRANDGIDIMIPNSMYPPPRTDALTLLKLNRVWTGIAFIYLSEYYLSLHNNMSEEHMIGGYLTKLNDSTSNTDIKYGYLTIAANSITIRHYQGTLADSGTVLQWQTRDCPTRVINSVQQVIYGHGAYYELSTYPTKIKPLPGEYLTLVW